MCILDIYLLYTLNSGLFKEHETQFHWAEIWGFLIRYITPVAVACVFLAKFFK